MPAPELECSLASKAVDQWLFCLQARDTHGVTYPFALREELWRLARKLSQERERTRGHLQRWSKILADIASLAFSIQQTAARSDSRCREPLRAFAKRLAAILARDECKWTDLTGQPLTPELQSSVIVIQGVELEDVQTPTIVQTLSPMVRWRGKVIRAAEVVVGYPATPITGQTKMDRGGESEQSRYRRNRPRHDK